MALLEVEGLTRHFGGLRAVADLSFSVREGEIVGLIGPNGAGKTTVFNLVTGFVRPSAGAIRLDGGSLVGLRPHAIARRGVARTFQIVKPFPGLSVKENVTLAAFLRHRSRHDADMLANQLTLMDQRRLEMAKALATGPRLVLLDEPMGGLNPTEVDAASELVRHMRAGGVTVILVEHVMKAIMRISDRVLVVCQGEKIADGPPAE